MKSCYLLYHIIHLVNEGHRWQYQNLNGSGSSFTLWFSPLQLVAILVAIIFIFIQPDGILHGNIIDYVLSSLSIIIGIYLCLLVFIYDRYKSTDFKVLDEKRHIRTWNFYCQLISLTSYSILIAILVILILISSLLFGEKTNIFDYSPTDQISFFSIVVFLRISLIVIFRLSFIYFLFDFFILCLFIVSGIFQFISSDMNESKPKKVIPNSKPAIKILWQNQRTFLIFSFLFIILIICLIFGYLFVPLSDVISHR